MSKVDCTLRIVTRNKSKFKSLTEMLKCVNCFRCFQHSCSDWHLNFARGAMCRVAVRSTDLFFYARSCAS